MVALLQVRVRKFLLRVVLLDEVLDDGSRFPQDEIGVWVFDGGVAAVGVDVCERLLLHIAEFERIDLVWDGELLKDQDDFPWVGPASCYTSASPLMVTMDPTYELPRL
jgi:hypothetical protein